MPRLTVRAETPQDERRIAEVTTRAFGKEREARIAIPLRAYDRALNGRVIFPPAFADPD